MKKWINESDEPMLSLRILKVMKHRRRSAIDDKKVGEFYSIKSKDWAVVVPVTIKDGKRFMTLVRQYRHGSDQISVEFPCGNIESGESPADGAERELKEESGMTCDRLIKIGSLSPNPAIMENMVHFFVAENAQRQFSQSLDEHEEIEILEMDEKKVITEYMGVDKEAKNAMMMTCLMYYVRYLKKEHGIDYFEA